MSNVGGVVDASGLVGEAGTPRTEALRRLRSLHAEERQLEIRRIALQINRAAARQAIDRVARDASKLVQGPLEAARFKRAGGTFAAIAMELRRVDQRLLHLDRDIKVATRRAVIQVRQS